MAIFNGKKNNETEIGFGSKNYQDSVRFLNIDGTVNVKRTGLGWKNNIDIYHWLINISLRRFILMVILFYAFINMFFATIYYLVGSENFGGLLSKSEMNKYIDLIFFSSQTITTVGYGHVYPIGHLASIISSIQSLLGLMIFAIILPSLSSNKFDGILVILNKRAVSFPHPFKSQTCVHGNPSC